MDTEKSLIIAFSSPRPLRPFFLRRFFTFSSCFISLKGMWKKMLTACLLLASCSSHSLEEYQYEGEALCRVLVKELEKIQAKEELAAALPKLKKHFHQLVELMIQAREYQKKHPEESGIDPAYYEHPYAEALKDEMARLCKLEGGREMLEKAQREALILLSKKR